MYRRIRHRRLSAVTNYRKRVASLRGGMRRLVVRKSNRGISVQVVEYEKEGDKVLAAQIQGTKGMGWGAEVQHTNCKPHRYVLGSSLPEKGTRIRALHRPIP